MHGFSLDIREVHEYYSNELTPPASIAVFTADENAMDSVIGTEST